MNYSFKDVAVSLYVHSAALISICPSIPLLFYAVACLISNMGGMQWLQYAGA